MDAPQLWLNGRQLTGLATDRAPVLCPVELDWGSDSAVDQPKPANLKFTVLFLDGMHDISDLDSGAKVELIHPSPKRHIFAGTIRTLAAEPSAKIKGALEVTANATDYTADLEAEYVSTDWPSGDLRHYHLLDSFAELGWTLDMPTSLLPSAQATYNSIKLVTLLDRHISRHRGRRYDTSYRTPGGNLRRRMNVIEGTSRFIPGDTLLADSNKRWDRTYGAPSIGGLTSPLVKLPASNVELNPSWTQDPDNIITAVNLSVMRQGDDGFTEQSERNFKAAKAVIERYGLKSTEVETDLLNSSDQATAAKAWMNDDSPWQMSGLLIRDSSELSITDLTELLSAASRYKALITVTNILANRPDPGPSVMRSYLSGGNYQWDGKRWQLTLGLERTIYSQPSEPATFTSIRNATNPNISTATLESIGRKLTFADFREIEAPK